jgi:NitT/TauT family transport system substrate-binding protein/putative hydroxymethylpyrimidine transport system substrate-binding protein
VREFRVDRFGAPAYPELILTTSREAIRKRPAMVRAMVGGTVEGYRFALAHPGQSLADLLKSVRGLSFGVQRDELRALLPAMKPPGGLDARVLRAWMRWDVSHRILRRPIDVRAAFDRRFLPRG